MPAIKYKVELSESERSQSKEVVRRGKSSARRVNPNPPPNDAGSAWGDTELPGKGLPAGV